MGDDLKSHNTVKFPNSDPLETVQLAENPEFCWSRNEISFKTMAPMLLFIKFQTFASPKFQ